MSTVTLELPWPPSVNRIWRQGKLKGQVYLDPDYRGWRLDADKTIMVARRNGNARVWGRFTAKLILDERQRRKNSDADNRVKVVMDALQRMMVIDDDALADKVSVEWGKANGVRVELQEVAACPA